MYKDNFEANFLAVVEAEVTTGEIRMNLKDALLLGNNFNLETTIIKKTNSFDVQTVRLFIEILRPCSSLVFQPVQIHVDASVKCPCYVQVRK